jgi:hypothetical protein
MKSFPVAASETFRAGEPVVVGAAGTITECLTDPPVISGIAAHRSTDGNGTDLGVGTQVTVYGTSPNQTFITNNLTSDGAGTAAVPALTNIGDLVGLALSGGVWSLDTSVDNLTCQIDGVQDVAGNNLGDPNVLPGAGVWVLFHFI